MREKSSCGTVTTNQPDRVVDKKQKKAVDVAIPSDMKDSASTLEGEGDSAARWHLGH